MYPSLLTPYGSYNDLSAYGAFSPYGTLTLAETSPAQSFAEPLSLDEVAAYLRIPPSMASDPAIVDELQGFIQAAREQAEIAQNRDLVVKTWDLALDYFPPGRIELRSPLVSVDEVRYRNADGVSTVLTPNTEYVVDGAKQPPMIVPAYNSTWPTFTPYPSSAVLIRFTSGHSASSVFWADAGGRLKTGMKVLIKSWFNRETLAGPQLERLDNLLRQGAITRVC